MKTSQLSFYKEMVSPARHATKRCVAAVLVAMIGFSWTVVSRAQQPHDNDVPGAEVLTRGPVHEAFAGIVTFNPQPGVVISKAPPEVIEEMPPDERPDGENVTWIPGYWGWDDERSDFLWVSGTWRALPPGREWRAGYWGQTPGGYQWISGYWADASVRETTYLPPPPLTVEVGPNIAAPSSDYGWSPGCWIWYQGRYAWRPGYWAQGRADWDWVPAHYVWTPRGCIFVGGYWDYSVERRGILFAPVYFEPGVYARRSYHYSPRIVINLSVFQDHLFLRPRYHHYYFGDYYAPSYYQGGFYASYSFQSSRHGYDPFFSRQRWTHRHDRDWERRNESSYHHRRDHEGARPPRTWAAQQNIRPDTAESRENRVQVATPIEQIAKRKDGPLRFQPVARAEREQLTQRGQEVQKSREQRRTLEAKAEIPIARKPGEIFQPAKVEIPRSPIVAKAVNQLSPNQAPPQAQQSPKPELQLRPNTEPAAAPQNAERINPQPAPRPSQPVRRLTPGLDAVAPQEKQTQQPAQRRLERRPEQLEKPIQKEAPLRDRRLEQQTLPESLRRAKDAGVTLPEVQRKAQEESQRNARVLEQQAQQEAERRVKEAALKTAEAQKAQQESEQRAREAAVRAQEESQRNARVLEQQAQQEAERRAKEAALKTAEETQRNARVLEQKTQQESEQRSREATVRAQEELQRNARALQQQAQQEAERRAKDAAVRTAEETQRNAWRLEQRAQQESEQRARDATVRAREESQRNARALQQQAQQESDRRAKDAAVRTAEETQRNARGLEQRAQQESEQRTRDAAVRAREESQRNADGSVNAARQRPAPPEKGAEGLMRDDRQKEFNEKR